MSRYHDKKTHPWYNENSIFRFNAYDYEKGKLYNQGIVNKRHAEQHNPNALQNTLDFFDKWDEENKNENE